jgi:hypothetical protein
MSTEELEKMKFEFPEMYMELFDHAHERLQREILLKYEFMKKQEELNEG